MLKPAFVANMSEAMADVYGAVTDRILINLAKYFPFLKAGAEMPGSFDYQARMLAQMGQINKETVDIIMSGLEGADQALRQALEASIIHALEAEEPKLRKAAEKGILQPPSVPEVVPGQMQAFQAYYRQSADKLNLVNTVMLESTQAAYTATVSDIANKIARTQSILNVGAGEVVTGVTAYNQAVRESVQKMVKNGITGFVDHGGHHWTPEAYAAMDIRTTMNNVARAATWERNEGYGNDLYQVSWHNGARPLCYQWQGKVISRSDMVREVQDLDGNTVHVYAQSETSYGEAAGLFGVNCGHYAMVFIPGISTLYDVPQDEEENKKDYEESQQQRALERKLREEKRDLEVMKAQGASEEEIKAQKERVRQASSDIQTFCDDTGRTRRRNRESTPVRATWPKELGEVTRFNGGYIDANAVPPPKGAISTPKIQPQNPQNVASQATQQPQNVVSSIYGKPFDSNGNQTLAKYTAEAEKTLANSSDETKNVWTKVQQDLEAPDYHAASGEAYFSSADKKVHFDSYKTAFDEGSYHRKNSVFFHEYGHNIDYALEPGNGKYYSYEYQNNAFGKSLMDECEERVKEFFFKKNGYIDDYDYVKASQNASGGMGIDSFMRQALRSKLPRDNYYALRDMMQNSGNDDSVLRSIFKQYLSDIGEQEVKAAIHKPDVGNDFIDFVKKSYTMYERADISDMFQRYTEQHYGIAFPFDVGHDPGYFFMDRKLPCEAFAEMYSATVTQSDSLKGINDFFPKSYQLFLKMLGDAV